MREGPELYWLAQRAQDIPVGGDDVWLVPRELETLERLHYTKRRADWRLGRWTAKRAVCSFIEKTGRLPSFPAGVKGVSNIEIATDADGAPLVRVAGLYDRIDISISHSGDTGFCVVTGDGVAVGCDIEKLERRSGRFISDYFSAEEKTAVESYGERGDTMIATAIWSAKESALKALKKGLVRDTRSVRVDLTVERERHDDEWGRLVVACDETGRTFAGWWRTNGRFVYTIAVDAAQGALKALVLSD